MRLLDKNFYEPPSEKEIENTLEKRRIGKVSGLKWKRVEYSFIENRMRGNFMICSMRVGQGAKYKLASQCRFPWQTIGNPAGASWEYCRDESWDFYRMVKDGRISNMVKIRRNK